MQVQFSSVAAIFVALLFVSGTVGCRSNGGDWYNPKTYSWTNPFSKEEQESLRPSDALANTKPSLDSQPNISSPPGGYTDRTGVGGRSGSTAAEPWAAQQHPMVSQTPPSHLSGLGGYTTVAESSSVPSYNPMEGSVSHNNHSMNHHSIAATTQQYAPHHNQSPYPQNSYPQQEMWQPQNAMPYGPSDYVQTGLHQPVNTGVYPQHQHAPMGGLGGMEHQQGNYAPYGTYGTPYQGVMPQSDPYAAVQQPATVPQAGFYDQQMLTPQQGGYPSGAAPAGFPPQPTYQQQPAGGFPY